MYVLLGYCGGGILLGQRFGHPPTTPNTVGIFGQLAVGVDIWAPQNSSIHFFSKLLMHIE